MSFEYVYELSSGENPAGVHIAHEYFYPFSIEDDKLTASYYDMEKSKWNELSELEEEEVELPVDDKIVSELDAYRFSGNTTWITWHWNIGSQEEDKHRIMLMKRGIDYLTLPYVFEFGRIIYPYQVNLNNYYITDKINEIIDEFDERWVK